MRKTHINGDGLDQLTNTASTASDTNSLSLSDQQTSLRENEPSSSGEVSAVLQAAIETGLIIVGLLYVALLLPRQISGDGMTHYQDLLHSLPRGEGYSSPLLSGTHPDPGFSFSLFQPHSRFSLVGPFFSIPLLLIGKTLGHPQEWTSLYNLTVFSLCLLVSYFLLRNDIDRALLRKFFLVLMYGSMFVAHLASYYGEVFTALCVGFGLLVTFKRSNRIGGWVAVVLGVVNTPATLIGLGLLVLKRMLDNKRLRYLLVFVAAAVGFLLECWIRRGSIFNTGYANDHGGRTVMPYSGRPGFSYPFFFGLLSILFSFGDGLLFYVPGLLLPIRKTLSKWPQDQKINLSQVYTLWICFVVGLILVYSSWWNWSGSVFWGPRFFLFACIPASFALAVRLMRYKEASLGVNLLTLVVFCLSAWVSIDGAVFQQLVLNISPCAAYHHAWMLLCWYTPDYSPLWQPFVFPFRIYVGQAIFGLFSLLVAVYIVTPLFIHLLKQVWDFAKQYSSEHLNLRQWSF